MTRHRPIISLIGLAGVARNETPRARRWGRYLEAPMLLLAIWIIIEWYLTAKNAYSQEWEIYTNWVIWIFFVLETVLLSFLVRDTKRYLISNWINLLIIAVGVPLLITSQPYAGALRSLRILLLAGMLMEMSGSVRRMLSRNHLGMTLLISAIVIVMAGISIAAIDPSVDTAGDGIWWAWVTVTTVGYGDIVPSSPQGRIFGGMLMILGLGLFSLMTANFSAFLITRDEEEVVRKEEKIIEKEEEIIQKEEAVVSEEMRAIKKLERIERRLENLEKCLGRLVDRLGEREASQKEASQKEASQKDDS